MAQIIYEKNTGELIPQGDRSVSTFPSGLIRVDQTFICSTPNIATHRSALKVGNDFPGGSDPAIDGLYIYPEVQEKRRGDGFSELIASGYGRTTSELNNIRKTVSNRDILFQYSNGSVMVYSPFTYSKNIINGFIVIEDGESISIDDIGLDDQLFIPYNIFSTNPDVTTTILSIDYNIRDWSYIDWNGDRRIKYTNKINFNLSNSSNPHYLIYYSPSIKVINRQNYGKFTELEISIA